MNGMRRTTDIAEMVARHSWNGCFTWL